jgi:hypothetical protein
MIRRTLSILALVAIAASPVLAQTRPGSIRERFWFSAGGGVATMGCQRCDGRLGGVIGDIAVGGTLSPMMQLAAAATGWIKSEGSGTLQVGTLLARFRFYRSVNGGAHLTAGVGLSLVDGAVNYMSSPNHAYDEPEVGFGAELGVGYDLRIGRMLNFTPFGRIMYVKTPSADANFGQIGLSITAH